MFKPGRWRSDKNKIKAVFKLQFHATQLAKLGVDALVISVVPGDVGKPTVRSEKAAIRDGSCRWENPVYETVKFAQDPNNGKISERIYNFIVSTGISKGRMLGEVSIDFADYAVATKASTVSLPLKNSNSNAFLHVSIQRMHENVDQRELVESEGSKVVSQTRSLKSQLSNGDADESINNNSLEDGPFNKTAPELNGNCRVSSGSDITLTSSESSSGLNTPRELGMKNNNHQDPTGVQSSIINTSLPCKPTVNGTTTFYEGHQRSQWEWSVGSDLGISTDNSTDSSQDTLPRESSQHASDIEIAKLKAELLAFARQADLSELELQTIRKQIAKESKRGQDLSREVVSLKQEREAVRAECEELKAFQKRMEDAKSKSRLQFEGGDPWAFLDEIRQELTYEKGLNANLRLQLQKTQESNAELILAVQDLETMLEQKNMEIQNLSNKLGYCENAEELRQTNSRIDTDDDEEQKALEELVKEHSETKETCQLEQKIMNLCSEIEIYRRDRDEIEMQMEQLALDYEILKQENHDMSYKLEQSQLQEQLKMQYECSSSFATITELESEIERLENELNRQSKELSHSLVSITKLETHIKGLEEELEKQAHSFEADLEAVTRGKVEQEQRAILAEEALRKTRLKNANTAERLQEEFKRLSIQMASTFDANEKVALKALTEASELSMQKGQLEEMLQKANEELQSVRDDNETKVRELSCQLNVKENQIEQMLSEIDNSSRQLEHQKVHEEEICAAFSQEILRLKAEIESLTIENNLILSQQAEEKEKLRVELEQMKGSHKETEALVQRGSVERNELVSAISLLKKDTEKSMEELNRMRNLKDEGETRVGLLQTELETLRTQYNDLKHSLFEDESEKEKLRKQVFQLKGDLKKKEDAFSSIEKKLKDSNRRAAVSDGAKTTLRNNKSASVPHASKEVASLRDKIKSLEVLIKLKETALGTSTNSFLEKEKDLQNKIGELESKMEELIQNSTSFCDYPIQKATKDAISISSNGVIIEEGECTLDCVSNEACTPKENGYAISLTKSIGNILPEEEQKVSTINNREGNIDELLAELVLLRERNKSMEIELKEMQERYSEISLKFAEVEGERQQLVMTVRNLKNAKKS